MIFSWISNLIYLFRYLREVEDVENITEVHVKVAHVRYGYIEDEDNIQ